jgi:acylphosphatase
MTIARRIHVEGLVQGVGFRWHARSQARSLGVHGWVRNLDDGRVEAHVEGEQVAVEAMLRWLASGPPSARVVRADAREVPPEGASEFRVLR